MLGRRDRLWLLGALLVADALLWGAVLLVLYVMLRSQGYAGNWVGYWLIAYSGFLVDAVLACATLWGSVAARGYREALRIALAVAVVPYMYDLTLRMAAVAQGWRLILPYGYYDPSHLLLTHAFPWAETVVLVLAAVLLGTLAVSAFERREV